MASTAQLRTAVLVSLLAHAAVVGTGAWLTSRPSRREPSQQVLVARLVRLGPQKPKELLPDQSSAPPPSSSPEPLPSVPTPPVTETQAPAPTIKPKPRRRAPAAPRSRGVGATLARLTQQAPSQGEASDAGDADEAEAGDAYAAEINRCIKSNYVIEGVDAAQVAGSRALVVVYVQRDGRIVRHKLLETSGQAAFDQAVSRAVERCGKVSPPPAAWRERLRTEGVEMTFSP